jgi:hypothetical protein
MRRPLASLFACMLALLGAVANCSSDSSAPAEKKCPIGAERCACTSGGSCDPGLMCLSEVCVRPAGGGESGAGGSPSEGGSGGTTTTGGSGGSASPGGNGQGGEAGTNGPGGAGGACSGGCNEVDVLFALDGSGSLTSHIGALSDGQAFGSILQALETMNCGDVSYRIGVTDDNDGGWYDVDTNSWFDSDSMTSSEIVAAFGDAASRVIAGSGTNVGCEHVLTSAKDLLASDPTGFLRPNALLVLVLVTDVDDYGAYDQATGNSCGIGCTTSAPSLSSIRTELLALKGNDADRIATIVVAGDPSLQGGMDFCDRPGSCGCSGTDCSVFHADRLEGWLGLFGSNAGEFADICSGASNVPVAVRTAIESKVDGVCRGL